MKIKINGISYFAVIHQNDKSKPNLILLHGFMGSGEVFSSLISELTSFCNPITVDLLGHGKTGEARSPKRFEAQPQVEDLAKVIQKTEAPPYLYGYSMGGRLALQLAAPKPKLLKGLILESTNPGLKNQKERNERKRLDEQRARKIEAGFDTFLEEWKQIPLFNSETDSDEDLERYHKIQRQQNPQQMAFSLRGFGTGQMSAVELDEIKIPVLLLAGEKDEKYVKIANEMDEKLPKSQMEIISGANHRVHLDRPEVLGNKLKAFVT